MKTLGLYLSGHPITRYEAELEQLTSARLVDLRPDPGRTQLVAGLLVDLRTLRSRRGRIAIMTLDDRSARMEAVVYAENFEKYRNAMVKDRLLVLEGELQEDEFTGGCSMIVSRVLELAQARAERAKHVVITLSHDRTANGLIEKLADVLRPFADGQTPVRIDYQRPDAKACVMLGDQWRVRPTEELLDALRTLAGTDGVRVQY